MIVLVKKYSKHSKMSKRITEKKIAEEVEKIKIDNENIDDYKSLDKNEIEKLVDSEATQFINLFHKSFYEFHENKVKKEEASADADLDSEDGVISDIICKIVAKVRSLTNLDKEEKERTKKAINTL